MLLPTLEKRIRQPLIFEKEFAKFWRKIGAKLVQEKTVAQATRYHGQEMLQNIEFFGTNPVKFETNMNSFTPPESEHFLITRIRYADGNAPTPIETEWTLGVQQVEVKNAQMTIKNNGVIVLQSESMLSFNSQMTTRDLGMLELEEPIAWIGQTILTVTVESPTAPPASTQGRVELIGIAYIS